MPFLPVPRVTAGWLAVLFCLAVPGHTRAQIDGVVLRVDPAGVGLGGFVQPGTWTPIRLTLENRASQPLRVACRWDLDDADGERVQARREASLTPQRTQAVWLYGVPPVKSTKLQW